MAPELLDRSADATKIESRLADIWAVGVMTFYVMTKDKGFRNWRSGFDQSTLKGDTQDTKLQIGKEGIEVSTSSVAFVVEATMENPDERLRWENASLHDWVDNHGPEAGWVDEEPEYVCLLDFSFCLWANMTSVDEHA